ncbi:tRNA-specific adenosine deaminase 1 [Brienomyrus brachyistius]|uniref:tRNA-specific adenosine deaminase 1 n=1 Tax=Brienomyrus brachyistius TaxID=42636 RepID=UPI0020B19534|nr:tRNA-specific adenosine deaminase 1 [Brienomyrus brachyistius]
MWHADEIARLCYDRFSELPKRGKPEPNREWTLLAAVVRVSALQTDDPDRKTTVKEVVSLATGTKCIGQSSMSPRGDILNDSHAEVVARRGFVRYLTEQLRRAVSGEKSEIFVPADEKGKWRIHGKESFVFFCSHTPCGDASIIPMVDNEPAQPCKPVMVERPRVGVQDVLGDPELGANGKRRIEEEEYEAVKRPRLEKQDYEKGVCGETSCRGHGQAQDSPSVKAPPSDCPLDQAPPLDCPLDQAPPLDCPLDQAPPLDCPLDQAPPPDCPLDQAPPPDCPLDQAPPPDCPQDQAPPPDCPQDQAPPPDCPQDQAPPPDCPQDQAPPPDYPQGQALPLDCPQDPALPLDCSQDEALHPDCPQAPPEGHLQDQVLPMNLPQDLHRTGAKCVPGAPRDPQGPGMGYHSVGVLRVKPGRGEPTLSLSCSDKLARWGVLGCQGALLSHYLQGAIYFSAVVIGKCPYSLQAMKRALTERCSHVTGLPDGFEVWRPQLLQSGLEFAHSHAQTNQANREALASRTGLGRVSPCGAAISWCAVPDRPLDVTSNGYKQGATKKALSTSQARSLICKAEFFRSFLALRAATADIQLPESLRARELLTYGDYKQAAQTYQQAWLQLRTQAFPLWPRSPRHLLQFK